MTTEWRWVVFKVGVLDAATMARLEGAARQYGTNQRADTLRRNRSNTKALALVPVPLLAYIPGEAIDSVPGDTDSVRAMVESNAEWAEES